MGYNRPNIESSALSSAHCSAGIGSLHPISDKRETKLDGVVQPARPVNTGEQF